ncbi:MAG: NgoFVII family restriction endonuclease [Methylophilaceae bacterium]|nr:NgoFVII family restriction endonuclease [Methylophilaceae bacterium]
MLVDKLFEQVLINPALAGADALYIVSGYATAAMASRHLEELKVKKCSVKIHLIVGMCPIDGITRDNHEGFKQLVEGGNKLFECSYVSTPPAVHAKSYVWLKHGQPAQGFVGSANYTQQAFGHAQRECIVPYRAVDAYNYYQSLVSEAIYCTYHDVEQKVQIYSRQSRLERVADVQSNTKALGADTQVISLLDRHGNLPARSGLNWGQRPEVKREPNQAYIRVPSKIYKSNFFPQRPKWFTIITDDDKYLQCRCAQDYGKAIHTPRNSDLGEYFRARLGVANGTPITKEDLLHYGRTDVAFYKIDDETYYMDFSSPSHTKLASNNAIT